MPWRAAICLVLPACVAVSNTDSSHTVESPAGSDASQSVGASWSVYLDGLGTFSSPRTADLNGDGVLDVVLGAGRQEFMATDTAVVALDGASGRVLWHAGARDQVFGSAAFADLTGDGVSDVVIGGRSAELMAIDGRSGALIWEFFPEGDSIASRERGLFNFYNAQVVPDQDGDEVFELVTANGGDVLAAPGDSNRPPGQLMLISGRSGRLLSSALVPDRRETYMSPVVADIRSDGTFEIVFGTGGETVGGKLFRTTLSDLLAGDVSSAVELAASTDRGFVGPPALVDLTSDGILDVVANAVDGRMLAFDGADNRPLWSVHLPGTEAYTSIAVGRFTDDDVPDLLASFAMGTWPDLGWSRQFMVDGTSGTIAFADSLGLYQTSSPVVADLNGDGRDDVIMSVNFEVITELFQKRFYTMLVLIDFAAGEVIQFGESLAGSNLSSTPWLGDLDGDELLDVIYCHTPDTLHTYVFNGLQINRIGTEIRLREPVVWGSYMGSGYDGVYRGRSHSSSAEP